MVASPVVHMSVWPLDQGFQTPEFTVISEQDILGERLIRRPKREDQKIFLRTLKVSLLVGLLFILITALARYIGLEVLDIGGAAHEMFASSNMLRILDFICQSKT